MNVERRKYVEFLYPGAFVNETSVEEVKDRDIDKLKIPDNAFGFRFFDVLENKTIVDDEFVKMTSDRINKSPMHYYGGQVYTKEDVIREVPNNEILLKNMESNDWDKIVKTRMGNFQPFEKTDIFIPCKTKK